jgi:hypothetical protein
MEFKKNVKKINWSNIGNPIAVGQKLFEYYRKRLTSYIRQGVTDPITYTQINLVAYTESQGLKFILRAVAEFICESDLITSEEEKIFYPLLQL